MKPYAQLRRQYICFAPDTGVDVLNSECDGHLHSTFSANIRLIEDVSHDKFKDAFIRSVIRLRHLAPGVAYRLAKLPSSEFKFSYLVPRGLDEALSWANEIAFVADDSATFKSHHMRLSERYWKASDERYSLEFHATQNDQNERSWSISYVKRTH